MIGTTVGHYRLIERLGAGGMGEVFLADDLRLGRQAAIKVIASHLTRDEPRRLRFIQEARLAASIDHPNIAAIYDVDQDGDRTYIAMEYVRGHTLRHLLRAGPLEPILALDLAIQVAGALAKVHERGVIHRDLKPDNVMVSADGYAKIIDFGLAKLVEPDNPTSDAFAETTARSPIRTEEGMVLGTVPYMSPEQARGLPIDARSDIFSFGAVVYEMLTGTAAFRRSTAIDTLGAILREDPPALSLPLSTHTASSARFPAANTLQRLVSRCLVKDASSRYQTMREVEGGLKGIREEMRTGGEIRSGAPIWAVGSRRTILSGVAVALLAAVGLVWWREGRTSTTDMSSPSSNPAAGVGLVAPAGHGARGRPAVAIVPLVGASRGAYLGWLA
jgi:serine/threonine protein kinase